METSIYAHVIGGIEYEGESMGGTEGMRNRVEVMEIAESPKNNVICSHFVCGQTITHMFLHQQKIKLSKYLINQGAITVVKLLSKTIKT